MVQTPADAEFDQMPNAAIEEDQPDIIDNAASLAGDLIAYVDKNVSARYTT